MLFGHQNDDVNQADSAAINAAVTTTPQDGTVNPLAVDPATGTSLPVAPLTPHNQADSPVVDGSSVLDQPVMPAADTSTAPDLDLSTISMPSPDPVTPEFAAPVAPTDTPTVPSTDTVAPVAPMVEEPALAPLASDSVPAPTNDELVSLKQQAIAQLTPLVDQLDQTPAERFRTTMMMIQSTDNSSLIKEAYEAAQGIPDEKVRAQALLDIVNEINYFTQQKPAA